ncbi:FkbM family methyltransferase [Lacibacter sp. H375]|uniref:FkbM family methyltransferase n=1 Tax=Lacibacter sp. H375 TaxID=3133424 RepID=UPI0030BEC4F2
MKIARICSKLIFFFYYLTKYKNAALAFNLSNNNVPPKRCTQVRREGNHLIFTRSNSRIEIATINSCFKTSLHYIIEIFNNSHADDIQKTEKGIILTAEGVSFHINSESNAGNFYEIICRKMYDYHTSNRRNVVLDIGMNAGLASLFFASKQNVAKVYSFEPFTSTIEEAKQNFRINPLIKDKIQIANYGVSNKNTLLTVPLFEGGSMEASTNQEFIELHQFQTKKEQSIEIELKDIKDILKEVIEKEQITDNDMLVLKVDCEGEEYNIVDRLKECGYLNKVSAFLMEWHHKGPDSLVKNLKEHNFKVLLSPITTVDGTIISEAGMLYAFK